MRIRAFTAGLNRPSARFRVRQLIDPLRKRGIIIDEDWRRINPALRRYPGGRGADLALEYLRRSVVLCNQRDYDLAIFQRPFNSHRMTLEGLWRKPFIFDIDDAVHSVAPRSGGAVSLAARADVVIAGNDTLAEFYGDIARRVEIVPTAVDTFRFKPKVERKEERSSLIVGWVGTSNNLLYLEELDDVLAALAAQYRQLRLLVICDKKPTFRRFPPEQLEFRPWEPRLEVDHFQRIDIGLMPLRDGIWERGKCSFKMLQYLACGSPAVVSPVGMNQQVLNQAFVGYAAGSPSDWHDAIGSLIEDEATRERMGKNGRSLVVNRYSVPVVSARVAKIVHSIS